MVVIGTGSCSCVGMIRTYVVYEYVIGAIAIVEIAVKVVFSATIVEIIS